MTSLSIFLEHRILSETNNENPTFSEAVKKRLTDVKGQVDGRLSDAKDQVEKRLSDVRDQVEKQIPPEIQDIIRKFDTRPLLESLRAIEEYAKKQSGSETNNIGILYAGLSQYLAEKEYPDPSKIIDMIAEYVEGKAVDQSGDLTEVDKLQRFSLQQVLFSSPSQAIKNIEAYMEGLPQIRDIQDVAKTVGENMYIQAVADTLSRMRIN